MAARPDSGEAPPRGRMASRRRAWSVAGTVLVRVLGVAYLGLALHLGIRHGRWIGLMVASLVLVAVCWRRLSAPPRRGAAPGPGPEDVAATSYPALPRRVVVTRLWLLAGACALAGLTTVLATTGVRGGAMVVMALGVGGVGAAVGAAQIWADRDLARRGGGPAWWPRAGPGPGGGRDTSAG